MTVTAAISRLIERPIISDELRNEIIAELDKTAIPTAGDECAPVMALPCEVSFLTVVDGELSIVTIPKSTVMQ